MFTKLGLYNFRSFGKIEFDLTDKGKRPKPLSIVYGENGAGKSNLMSAFVLLKELLATMDVRDIYEDFLSRESIFTDEKMEKALRQQIISGMRDMRAIIDDCRMVGSQESIIAEYEFNINGNIGRYLVELSDNEISHERLEYLLDQRRGVYFDCTPGDISINSRIVKSKDLLNDIRETAKRFWGKHSILAIIIHELDDKSNSYGQDNISENFNDVIAEFSMLSCSVKIGDKMWDKLYAPYRIFEEADSGRIERSNETQLDIAEYAITQFFSAINSDIRKVYYQKVYSDKYIDYKLIVEKMVSGIYRNIEFSRESTGNHQLLRVLCYLLSGCMGGTVIVDEADSGIHDLLFQKILQEAKNSIHGQIIMTTHNTMLMETDLARDATYILSEEDSGQKTIRCVTDYEKRTYINNNIRNKYLNGEYGGLPKITAVDFDSILRKIQENIELR